MGGSYLIDVRDSRWQRLIVHEIAPATIKAGFTGFFLDTLDNAIELERRNPARYAGMRQAAASIIRQLKAAYPDAPIMLNRAFELTPEVGPVIDYILGESVYHTWLFGLRTQSERVNIRPSVMVNREHQCELRRRMPCANVSAERCAANVWTF